MSDSFHYVFLLQFVGQDNKWQNFLRCHAVLCVIVPKSDHCFAVHVYVLLLQAVIIS